MWEYKIEELVWDSLEENAAGRISARLNELGGDGWELVATYEVGKSHVAAGAATVAYHFKRQRKPQGGEFKSGPLNI